MRRQRLSRLTSSEEPEPTGSEARFVGSYPWVAHGWCATPSCAAQSWLRDSDALQPKQLDQARGPEHTRQDRDSATVWAAVPPELPGEARRHDEQHQHLKGRGHAQQWQRVLEREKDAERDDEAEPRGKA